MIVSDCHKGNFICLGFIGRIKLQIPVSRLKSEPWVISMDQLYLVAGPLREDAYSEEAEKKSQEDRKKAALTALEEKWKVGQNREMTL